MAKKKRKKVEPVKKGGGSKLREYAPILFVSVFIISILLLTGIREILETDTPLVTGASTAYYKGKPSAALSSDTNAKYKCKDCNVVVIVFDAQRFDHLGYSGYDRDLSPNIDEFARENIVFKNAYSQSPWTKPSIASLFTSQYPHIHRSFDIEDALADSALTLAEILSANGYTSLGVIENPFLDTEYNLNQGFDFYTSEAGIAKELTDLSLSRMKDTNQPFFAYLHYIDPHHPYDPPPEYQIYIDKDYEDVLNMTINLTVINVFWVRQLYDWGALGEEDIEFYVSSYDGEIYYADSQVKRVFDYLKDNGLWDNTIVIFTADHGDEFFEHGSSEHGHTVYNELLHVPLIIRNPRLDSGEVDTQVRLIDLAPTILDTLDLPIPASFQGVSLKPLMVGEDFDADTTTYGEALAYYYERKSIQSGDWKFIFNTIGFSNDEESFELYNIATDPGEQNNVISEYPEIASTLNKSLIRWINTTSPISETFTVKPTDELLEQIKALGYVT